MASKVCSRCNIEKTLKDFPKTPGCKDGRASYCKVCRLVQSTAWRDRNKDKVRGYQRKVQLKSKYGLSLQEYERLLAKFAGACHICKNVPTEQNLSVDHNHQTGKVRGLLCQNCNTGLGKLQDSKFILQAALSYLEETDGQAL